MIPNRSWQRGDRYWELWIARDIDRYVPLLAGVVAQVDENVVRLYGGSWRYDYEGLPFLRRADAVLYSARNLPSDVDPASEVRRSSPHAAPIRTTLGV